MGRMNCGCLLHIGMQEEEDDEEEDAPKKQHTYSYWSVDYPRAYDMIQLRLTIMRKLLKVRPLVPLLPVPSLLSLFVVRDFHDLKKMRSCTACSLRRKPPLNCVRAAACILSQYDPRATP